MLLQPSAFELLFFKIAYPDSFFGFGFPRAKGSFFSSILQAKDDFGTRELFGINRWMHACVAYDKAKGIVKVFRVRNHINMKLLLSLRYFYYHEKNVVRMEKSSPPMKPTLT